MKGHGDSGRARSVTKSTVADRGTQPDLVGFGDSHGDGEMVGESVLIDRLALSAEWDRLREDTWIDHGRHLANQALIVKSPLSS